MVFAYQGSKFYYERIGKGMPILMLHGLGADKELMKGCLEPVLAKSHYQRIYFDLPGMGESDADFSHCSADGILQVLTAFIQENISGDFLVMGQSYGGYLARGVLSAFPEQVAGLFLLCPVVIPEREKRSLPLADSRQKKIDVPFFQSLTPEEQDYMEHIMRINPLSYRRVLAELISGSPKANTEFIAELFQNYRFSFPLEERIGMCQKPVSVLTGRQDKLTGYQDVWALLENYPKATFLVADMAGHGLQIDQPELFSVLVKEWLKRVEEEKESSV